ncbi:MAG TPA: protein phosphatase 2C domain-containing protein [Candidatus Competibacter sp.]|nr:protein phosphatase 2C domain-containing protein [Candidatus Competibacter sp.]HUM95672.1 protein phosphatase 2C domain-containing protein [Candidatus Competibacter sp.]
MTIALDSYYTIGKLHLYCQDYVIHGWEPFPYVILADGCSASPNSDVGARLLALNARSELSRFAKISRAGGELPAQHWALGQEIAQRAARCARQLDLNPEALDATLLVAWCDGAAVHVHAYGDGCIATRDADGQLAVIEVEYAQNAPYYLTYLLQAERHALYEEAIGNVGAAQTIRYSPEEGSSSIRRERFDAPVAFSFDLATYPTVAITTDGLGCFLNAETSQRIAALEIARGLFDFGGAQDAFVVKHMQSALVELSRRLLFNLDDLSVGAFVKVV